MLQNIIELTPALLIADYGFEYDKLYSKNSSKITQLQATQSKENIFSYLCEQNIFVSYNDTEYCLNSTYSFVEKPIKDVIQDKQLKSEISVFYSKITQKNAVPNENLSFAEIINIVKSVKYKAKIEKLRTFEYKSIEYNNLKLQLNYFTPAGIFDVRNNESIKQVSNLICLDLDFAENKDIDLQKLKTLLTQNSTVIGFFTSPSNLGLKIFIKASFDVVTYFDVAKQVREYFEFEYSISLDKAQNKLSQPCFFSYDIDSYYNENAILFYQFDTFLQPLQPLKKETTFIQDIENIDFDIDSFNTFEVIEKILAKENIAFFDGAKHSFLNKFAIYSNKFGIDYNELLSYVETKYISKEQIKSNCLEYPYKNYKKDFGTFKIEKPKTKAVFSKKSIKDFKAQKNVYFNLLSNCIREFAPKITKITEIVSEETGELLSTNENEKVGKTFYKVSGGAIGLKLVNELIDQSKSNLVQKIFNFITRTIKANSNIISLKQGCFEEYYKTVVQRDRYNKALVFLLDNNIIQKTEFTNCYAVNYNYYFNGNIDKFLKKLYIEIAKK